MEATETIERAGNHEMRVMDGMGDTKVIWSSENADEVANARKTFDELRAKRFVAFRVNKLGNKGEQISTFDPDAEKMILVPPLVGG